MSWSRLCIVMCALTLTGCGSLSKPLEPPPIPASLRQPCPPLQPPADGTGAMILRTLVEWAGQYRECADRHQQLAQAVTP